MHFEYNLMWTIFNVSKCMLAILLVMTVISVDKLKKLPRRLYSGASLNGHSV